MEIKQNEIEVKEQMEDLLMEDELLLEEDLACIAQYAIRRC